MANEQVIHCYKCNSTDVFLDDAGKRAIGGPVWECRVCGNVFVWHRPEPQPSEFPVVTEARERAQRRARRIAMLRHVMRVQVWHWFAVAVIVGLALSMAWNEHHRANEATARALAATAPKPGPQTLTLVKWEPVFEITHEPNPPAGDGFLWKYDKATIRVKVSDRKHEVYDCTGPTEKDGPIADYSFRVEGRSR